jgi:hypothetical protein
MKYKYIRNDIADGTHRVRAYRIERGRTRYVLERLNAKYGWLTVPAHGNTLRLAVRDLPHRYDMTLGVVYDAAAIAQQSEAA